MLWAWTGFTGNKLWDWLELIALPLAIGLSPIYDELRSIWSRGHWLIAGTGLSMFIVIVVGGYVGNWGWTGFRGNTLWDWLHLLLLPLLLPTLVVPALRPRVKAGLILVDEHESAPPEPHLATGERQPLPAAPSPPAPGARDNAS